MQLATNTFPTGSSTLSSRARIPVPSLGPCSPRLAVLPFPRVTLRRWPCPAQVLAAASGWLAGVPGAVGSLLTEESPPEGKAGVQEKDEGREQPTGAPPVSSWLKQVARGVSLSRCWGAR